LPIGQNARSTPATYSGAFDQVRRLFAGSAYARRRRWKPEISALGPDQA
jgi:excinuclease ABC subunit A